MEDKSKVKNKINGFTLIETLVSIMMVSIAFLGIYSATAKYSQQTKQLKDTYVASLLGQEGIEIVRNIRDKNWLTSVSPDLPNPDFSNGLTGYSCSATPLSTEGAEANYDDTGLSAYNSAHYLYILGGNSFYKYLASPGASDVKTNYRRQICIDSGTANELHVAVYIYWTGGKQTVVKEDLYNWKW
ncbi:MAG: type II secretion system protein [Candidatus Paceibacterota bacterium]